MMNKLLRLTCVLGLAPMIAFAQPEKKQTSSHEFFDYNKAVQDAKKKGIPASDIEGYVDFLQRDFASHQALEKSGHKHTPYENPFGPVHQTVINLTPGNNTAQRVENAGCTNIGFEQYNFSGWTGTTGQVSIGSPGTNPNYTATGTSIVNTAGNNVFMRNTLNYHTIMTIPPTNNVYPNCNPTGYDSAACRVAGTQTISEIPFISPYSFDGVSVRMNGMNANYRACQLKYIVTTSATVKRVSFSYAVVLQNPSGHLAEESPYFKVEVKNENTNTILPGCTSYTFNPKTTSPADSLKQSVVGSTFDPTMYRKWQYYSVDLSTLPVGTPVSINFEVGGCTQSGHWGYAYVDAECGGVGVPYSNMCAGSTSALLVAPSGFISYQWYDPSNSPVAAPQGQNDSLVVNPAVAGQVYTVKVVSAGSCSLTLTDTIHATTVSIINTNSSPSCQNGASGSAQVTAAGSNGTLLYSWTNSSGAVVSTSATATGLAPGNYTITVSSTACGSASQVVNVGVSPPQFYTYTATYCGNIAFITKPGQSSYQWYNGTTPIAAPQGTNDTLYINTPVVGGIYYLTSTNPSGCRDSAQYTLSLIGGGNVYTSIDQNVCPGNTNGIAVINLQTINNPTYNYSVRGPGGYASNQAASSSKKDSLNNLAPGSYSYTVNDGACIYTSTFTISTIPTPVIATPVNSVVCFPTDTAKLTLSYGALPPTSCGITPFSCTSPNTLQLFPPNTSSNGGTSYPTPYGNFYTYSKQQFLVLASDLHTAGLSAGKISNIAFNVVNLNNSILSYPNFEIKMGCTPLTSFTTSFVTGLSTVYSVASQPVTLGWNTHNFQQSFLWDGNSNVVVDVCFGMNTPFTYNANGNCSVEYVATPYVASNWHVEDQNPVCSSNTVTPNGFGSHNYVPNMRFGFCQASPPPTAYTVTVLPSTPTPTISADNEHITLLPTFTVTPSSNTTLTYTIHIVNPVGGCVKDTVVSFLYAGSLTDVKTNKDTTVCYGAALNFSASNANGYTWYYLTTPTSSLNISTSSTIAVTPPVVGTNTYIVRGGGFCGAAPDFDTIVVTVKPIANLEVSPMVDVTKCMYSSYTLHAGVGSITPGNTGTPYNYQWTLLPGNTPAPGGTNASSYTASSNSTQTLVITVTGQCANGDADTVVVKNFPDNLVANIIDSASVCSNSPFTLHSSVTGGEPGYTYVWTLMPSTQIGTGPSVNGTSPDQQGNYVVTLSVSDSCGITKSDYQVINVQPPCSVTIPNVITPNGDGVNDYFIVTNMDKHPNSTLTIFDRWGKKVFESPDYQNNWKADGVSDGTFFYILNVPDDKTYNGYITVFHK